MGFLSNHPISNSLNSSFPFQAQVIHPFPSEVFPDSPTWPFPSEELILPLHLHSLYQLEMIDSPILVLSSPSDIFVSLLSNYLFFHHCLSTKNVRFLNIEILSVLLAAETHVPRIVPSTYIGLWQTFVEEMSVETNGYSCLRRNLCRYYQFLKCWVKIFLRAGCIPFSPFCWLLSGTYYIYYWW